MFPAVVPNAGMCLELYLPPEVIITTQSTSYFSQHVEIGGRKLLKLTEMVQNGSKIDHFNPQNADFGRE